MRATLKRFWWVGVIILLLIGALIITVSNSGSKKMDEGQNIGPADDKSKKAEERKTSWPSQDAKYITAVPLDLTQIQSISKYRSCAGHDSSGYSFERLLETERSMKHYIYPVSAFQGTLDKVKMFAPFDGTVSDVYLEADHIGEPGKRPKSGNGITLSTPIDPNVSFEFGHIYFVKDYKIGDEIKAGELVGYAALGEKGNDFDVVLTGAKWAFENGTETMILGSAFDHMTDSVIAEFATFGITPENTKDSKEYRDANPCNYASSTRSGGRTGQDWVQLSK
ncbi:MAG: hypothetical protein NUV80_00405 [Candidatus Berkelbacteria bacterium]|nr:hypothetical protein [Candidatus Berkelbacteria bacterium]